LPFILVIAEAAQAKQSPESIAIESWDGRLSYLELDQMAHVLGVHLQSLGVRAESLVLVCFEKSKWAVVAQLAILKAGGGCVAVDFAHPKDRLRHIIEQTDAKFVVCSASKTDIFRDLPVSAVPIDSERLGRMCQRTGQLNMTFQAKPFNAAYVVFTSGSTGAPKGILLEHMALCTSVRDHGAAMKFTPESRVLQFAAYTFDVSIADMFTTLIFGGTICIPSEEERMNDLTKAIQQLEVNQMYLTPTVAGTLKPAEIPKVKKLSLGGEAVRKEDVAQWADRVALVNIYGPAECSIWCTYLGGLKPSSDPNNFGRAIGCHCWLVDPSDHHKLAPISAVGEIVIEGPIVARHYVKDTVKTAAAFIHDPAWSLNGSGELRRFYKSGDLAKYNSDGTLSFIGRKDTQIKLRGQRIEIGEVEYHLKRSLPFEAEIAVEVLRLGNEKAPMLVAFISRTNFATQNRAVITEVLSQNHLAEFLSSLSGIRARMSTKVPSYMIPALFLSVTRIPKTPSGKTDRKGLRGLGAELLMEQLTGMSPEDSAGDDLSDGERQLRKLMARILRLHPDYIGRQDSFMTLGGDSVGAIKLVSAARAEGINITVSDILQSRSFADLYASAALGEQESSPNIPPLALLGTPIAMSVFWEEAKTNGIQKEAVEDVLPCTPLQEGILALSLKQPGSYIGQHIIELPKDTDFDRYRAAWQTTINESKLFRSRIFYSNALSMFVQAVTKENIVWSVGKNLEEYLANDKGEPMEPGHKSARFAIVSDPQRVNFVLTAHHALYDGWSLAKTIEFAKKIYLGCALQRPPPYASFISHILNLGTEASKSYWREQLESATPSVFPTLPTKSYQPLAESLASESIVFPPRDLTFTSATLLRAAWSIVLARHIGSPGDVIFGCTLSGRNAALPGVQDMLGPTMTTVPLRIEIDPKKTVEEFLQQVQCQAIDMIPHEHTGLQTIAKLSPEIQAACMFQSLLVIQPIADSATRDDNSYLLQGFADVVANTYAFMMECFLSSEGCTIRANFDANVISEQQTKRILRHIRQVIQQLCIDRTKTVQDVEVLTGEDMAEILAWNADPAQPVSSCVHTLFQQQVLRTPSEPAIDAWDGRLSYQELAQLSNRLACHLKSLGVGPEVYVPLCFEKSMWAIVANMAVLKAGGACVSVDPVHPLSRIQLVLEGVNATMILCSNAQVTRLSGMQMLVVPVSAHIKDLWDPSFGGCEIVRPHHAAFVVYTSGSTGRPKGIVQEHGQYCTALARHGEVLGTKSGRRVLQFAAHTFDAFLSDVFSPLAYGACVCIPSEDERMNNLVSFMNRFAVNQSLFTPSVLRVLSPETVPLLKTIIMSGELLSKQNFETWAGTTHVINLYGPSEVCVWCTYNDKILPDTNPRNIGRGVGAMVWISDPSDPNRLAPVGAIGELLMHGPTLAREYIGDPEKTKHAFVNSPTWMEHCSSAMLVSGRRAYRTGDLARYNDDGTISIIGRRDTQIKLRGQRVELEEVEFYLRRSLPKEVRDLALAMVSLAGKEREKILMAFLVLDLRMDSDRQSISKYLENMTRDLAKKLSQFLPSYMIPTAYYALPELPITLHSKLDRKKLQDLGSNLSVDQLVSHTNRNDGTDKQQPTNSQEKTMRELWARTLDIPLSGIGINDNFLSLGGDSISAMKLVAASRSESLPISVADIFRSSSLQELAHLGNENADKARRHRTQGAGTQSIQPFSLLNHGGRSKGLVNELAAACDCREDLIEDAYPCTPLQEGFMVSTAKITGAYISQEVFNIPPSVDIPLLKRAWNRATELLPILRTRVVHSSTHGMLQVVVNLPATWREADDLDNYLESDCRNSIHFGGELQRYAVILEKTKGSNHFVWTAHHAVYDGWSRALLFKLVEQLYASVKVFTPPDFRNLVAYNLDASRMKTCERYWQGALRGFETSKFPPLPSTSCQTAQRNFITHFVPITRQKFSSTTTPTIIKAAWSILVARRSESSQAVFGMTVTGRNSPIDNIEQLIGPTLATVPFCVSIDPAITSTDFLHLVQDQSMEITPFEHFGLQNIRKVSKEAQEICAFHNILVIQPPEEQESFLGMTRRLQASSEISNFNTYPIMAYCELKREGAQIELNFDPGVLSMQQVQRIMWQFQHIIQQLCVEEQEAKVSSLTIISPEDEAEITRWNSNSPAVVEACLHSLFKEQAAMHPDQEAICSWDGSMTYHQLDDKSTRLCQKLYTMGVKHQDRVPLCFEKSKYTIVSILAVLKAGATFVPMDPSHPEARLRGIIQDTQAKIVLTSPLHSEMCSRLTKVILVVSSSAIEDIQSTSEPHDIEVSPKDVSHILFTSGSTGKSKGVVIEHWQLASSIAGHAPAMGYNASARVLQFSSYAFDVSIADMLSTLTRGGCVCIPSEEIRTNVDAVIKFMNDAKVNLACLTPSFVKLLRREHLPHLRTLILGGEIVGEDLIKGWSDHLNLTNGYGPTEANVYSTIDYIKNDGHHLDTIGVGVSCNTWITDIDDFHSLAPVGCIGELLVEGPNVARCYLDDEAKTKDSFIQDPAWAYRLDVNRSRRFYRTGDLAQYREDGTLKFLGRKDTQVKIRGQRLELGEIEQSMISSSFVKDAIVCLPKTGPCENRLVAVMTLQKHQVAGTTSELQLVDLNQDSTVAGEVDAVREFLTDRLPVYMMPMICCVEKIPLLASGKLNRLRTKEWVEAISAESLRSVTVRASTTSITPPLGPVEEQLLSIWSAVLDIPSQDLDTRTSFIAQGGDSITAMQVMARCRSEKVLVSVQDILRCKSLKQLALMAKPLGGGELVVAKERLDVPFELSPIQKFHFELEPHGQNHFNQSFCLKLNAAITPETMRSALHTVVQRHSMLRARYTHDENIGWSQRITSDVEGSLNFTFHQVANIETCRTFTKASHESLDIRNGPLLRVDLFRHGAMQIISFVAHHLVIDLVSWRIIFEDLEALLKNQKPPGEPLSFQSWSELQRSYTRSSFAPRKVLPINIPECSYEFWNLERERNVVENAIEASVRVDPVVTKMLLGECNNAFRTESIDLFLAAILYSFSQVFSERGPAGVFNEGHGREPWNTEIDITKTVGWFTTLCPISASHAGLSSLTSTIREVKDNRRQIPNKGWDYFSCRYLNETGQETFNKHRDMEILFNYNGLYQQLDKSNALLQRLDDRGFSCPDMSTTCSRLAIFMLSAEIIDGALNISLEYNKYSMHQERILEWLEQVKQSLIQMSTFLPQQVPEFTPSDFPLLDMTPETLNNRIHRAMQICSLSSLLQIVDAYALLPIQKMMVNSQRTRPGLYAVSTIWKLSVPDGFVDESQLLKAWQLVVNCHPALRTAFVTAEGAEESSIQIVLQEAKAHTRVIPKSLSASSFALENLADMQPPNYVDTSQGHAVTLWQGADSLYCRLDLSHAITDGVSTLVLIRDWQLAYTGKLGVESSSPFRNLVSYIHDQSLEQINQYWTAYLNGLDPCLLPMDTSTPAATQSNEIGAIHLSVHDRLQAFCRVNGVTPSNVLHAAWALLLWRYLAMEDVCFGYLISGRDAPLDGISESAGPHLCLLTQKLRISATTTLLELVQGVQADYLSSTKYSYFQGSAHLDPQKPLFNSVINFRKYQKVAMEDVAGLQIELVSGKDPWDVSLPSTRV